MGSWLQQTFIVYRQNTLCLAGFDYSSSATMKYVLLCFTLHIKTDVKPLYLPNTLTQKELPFIQACLLLPHVGFMYHSTHRWLFSDVTLSFRWCPSHQYFKPQCLDLQANFWVWDFFFKQQEQERERFKLDRKTWRCNKYQGILHHPSSSIQNTIQIRHWTMYSPVQDAVVWCSILNYVSTSTCFKSFPDSINNYTGELWATQHRNWILNWYLTSV